MAISRRIARPLLSSAFFVNSIQVLKDPSHAADQLRPHTARLVDLAQGVGIPLPQDPALLARVGAGIQLGAAAALTLGKAPRLSAAVLTATLLPSVAASRPKGTDSDSTGRRTELAQAARGVSLVGGLLLASVDTEGRPGVAWRARRMAKDARREAKHLAKETALEARLATASLH